MFDYLISCQLPSGKHAAGVYTIPKIAFLLAHDELDGCTNLRVWRVLPNQEPQPVQIHHDAKSHTVWTTDRYGNEIENTRYPA